MANEQFPKFIFSKSFKELLPETYERILVPPPSLKFKLLPQLSQYIGGLRDREFTIFCGPTGAGKTSVLAQFALDLALQGIGVFVASVETGRVDFSTRMISCAADENWNTGEAVDLKKVIDFKDRHEKIMDNFNVHFAPYEDRVSMQELLANIKYHVENHACKVAILDNLNFFTEVTKSQEQIIAMDEATHEAIIFCKQNDVHIFMVMHPRKLNSTTGQIEHEDQIKGSSTAVQEAHNILILNKVSLDEQKKSGDFEFYKNYREIKIVKCRRIGTHVGKSLRLHSYNGVRFYERSWDDGGALRAKGINKNVLHDRRYPDP